MDHQYCRVSPPAPQNVLTLDNVGSVPDCDGSSDSDGDSWLSDYPPSKSCNCGKCPYSPGPVEQLMDASPSSLPTIVGGDSDGDSEIFMIRPPGPVGRFVCPHDESRPCSSPSEPGSPDSRVTVSDSSSVSKEAGTSSYDASDEYAEGDDVPRSSPTREMSSDPEPDPDGLVSSVDLQLGAACEVTETALSPLPVLPPFRIYTSEEESYHALQQVQWQISDRTRRRWLQRRARSRNIEPEHRPRVRRGYYVAERAIRGRRRHRPWYGQTKRIRLDNASWGPEANSSSETIPEEVTECTPTRLFA